MTKAEFVDRVADNSGLGKGEAGKAVDAVLDSIQEVLSRGGEINFTGFEVLGGGPQRPPGSEPANRREDPDRGQQGAALQRGSP